MTTTTATTPPPKPLAQPKPPLPLGNLQALFISKLTYVLQPTVSPLSSSPALQADFEVWVSRRTDPGERQVSVQFKLRSEEGAIATYIAEAEAIAIVNGLPTDEDPNRIDKHSAAVAAPLAVNVIREQFLSMSARGPCSRLLIPLIPAKTLVDAMKVFNAENTAS